jgi:amino acid transporter
MIAYLPIPGGHIKLAERFVDGAFSFTMGWNYWYNWTIILPAELSAASVLVDFWDKNTKLNSLWIVICLIVVVCINFMGAGNAIRTFSHHLHVTASGQQVHTEKLNSSLLLSRSSLSLVRCTLVPMTLLVSHDVSGLIILGIILDLGGGPDHDRLGFRYWKHPGPFVQYNGIAGAKGRFLGWWAVMTQAAFSYIGTEIVAVRASPRHP